MSKKKSSILIVVFLFLSACMVGGGCGQPRPADLPKLYPTKVTVTNKGAPVSDATVTFAPEQGKWSGYGMTDEKGTTTLNTYGYKGGVPSGKYKVMIEKANLVRKSGSGENAEYDEVSVFDTKFAGRETTPLEFTVEEKKLNEAAFEIE